MNSQVSEEDRIRARRRQMIEEARRRKKRQMLFRRLVRIFAPPVLGVIAVFFVISTGVKAFSNPPQGVKAGTENASGANTGTESDGGIAGGKIDANGGAGINGQGNNGYEIEAQGMNVPGNGAETGNAGAGQQTDGQPAGARQQLDGQPAGADYQAGTGQQADGQQAGADQQAGVTAPSGSQNQGMYSAQATAATKQLGGDIISSHAIFIDMDSDTILAQKDGMSRMNPASMTKVLTVLVAAEHVTNLDDTFTITLDITDYSFVNGCSNVGFLKDETVTVRDLFYGTVLPSGADAAGALAVYVAGSMEAFADMMNQKLDELGLSQTAHFTNCVGVYDENHYCTAYDMAVIMEAALNNDLCREVLSAHTYITSPTEQHPEGIPLSNWFLRRIEDKDTGGEVLCGKTGYVLQSGNCAVSYGVDAGGKNYICVTAGAGSVWQCINDQTAIYKQFATGE